ncbi:Sec20 domain protein [Ophiocordyceps camponoti-floridani]|uniref:Sec20 domain protein n=1 Tax=Ophiocordyceps camponoti-floridani TaxID=2030778 RepID=A0A8H4VGB2_9HYPO|nr:Sec20 domain protein [Ophiocordyceps camponoti-floridani]
MSLQGLHERLTALQETTTQLRDLIDRLAGLDLPSPDTDADEECAEIGQLLRSGLDEQELLWEDLKYARPEGHDKERLKDGAERLRVQLSSHRAAFRKARLAAKKRLEAAQRRERDMFVRSLSMTATESGEEGAPSVDALPSPSVRRPRPSWQQKQKQQQQQQSTLSRKDQLTVGASGNVTTALRRTHDLIAAELSRSEFAHQTLTESSAALKQLDESYMSLEGMLASSRDLLGTLLRSQKSDTWYLQTALYMLLVTGAWLFFRRILYGPLWWLLWLPLRTFFGIGSRAGSAVLRTRNGGGRDSSAVMSDEQAGPAVVVGMPGDELPTARVGRGGDEDEGDLDSVMDRVREAVEAVGGAEDVAWEAETTAPVLEPEEVEARDGDDEGVYVRDEL